MLPFVKQERSNLHEVNDDYFGHIRKVTKKIWDYWPTFIYILGGRFQKKFRNQQGAEISGRKFHNRPKTMDFGGLPVRSISEEYVHLTINSVPIYLLFPPNCISEVFEFRRKNYLFNVQVGLRIFWVGFSYRCIIPSFSNFAIVHNSPRPGLHTKSKILFSAYLTYLRSGHFLFK